ncbi:hypothetical protein [Streptomyces sp. NBC_00576]|uniref:hypothetical protein n=1 Tax=Streptomyces sp. NBC_00576 TaxID=2903665 RepID=UPI002E8026AB|nr:hypothetical protein [Streptomyces sp. NBC_00576]WUB73002.1 hypothetical protein OG734_24545 [Streptomyces sp. NBC_00576]
MRRSPYSTDQGPLDGSASRLSRPYLPAALADSPPETDAVTTTRTATVHVRPNCAARERAVRLRRRAITVLAVDFGIDADTRDIHAELNAVRAR